MYNLNTHIWGIISEALWNSKFYFRAEGALGRSRFFQRYGKSKSENRITQLGSHSKNIPRAILSILY